MDRNTEGDSIECVGDRRFLTLGVEELVENGFILRRPSLSFSFLLLLLE
jgi:hypothetical protein